MQPDLGSNMSSYLFEPMTAITASALESEIRNAIKNYEPRAQVKEINVIAIEDKNAFYIELTFFIGNNTQPTSVNLLLERRR
jgi:phage baseplate assembly protein W